MKRRFLEKRLGILLQGVTLCFILMCLVSCKGKEEENSSPAATAVPAEPSELQLEFEQAIEEVKTGKSFRIRFYEKQITDDDVKKLAELDKLLYLCLVRSEITNASMPIIAKIPGLIDLDLAGTMIDNDGLKPLANHPTLQRLVINQTPITNDGLAVVATIPNLGTLELYQCFITDDAMKYITKMKNLRKISLDSTRVTDASVPEFFPMTNLRKLQVWDTGITEDGRRQLFESMPNIELNDNYKHEKPVPPAPEFPLPQGGEKKTSPPDSAPGTVSDWLKNLMK